MIDKATVKNNRLVRNSYYFLRGITQKKALEKKALATLAEFGIDPARSKDPEGLIRDMLRMNRLYGYEFKEYLYYRFCRRPMAERLQFIADWEHLGYTCAMNNSKNGRLFDNKWETYQKYGRYYGREMMAGGSGTAAEELQAFMGRHARFVAKPIADSAGRGIRVIDAEDADPEALLKELQEEFPKGFVLEELIVQDPEMGRLHPASVNTLRVPTIRTDTETVILHPRMRIGQHGSFVDNAGAGGIVGVLDAETGTIVAAADEMGHTFQNHPETGEPVVGFTVPRWPEAAALVRELAQVTPDNRYTGWDIALTKDGWVMVEANRRGQFMWQIPLQKGSRGELNAILHSMGLKY